MALATAFLSEDQFTCSICLDVFNNPVSTPCGHSFCQGCISSYWDSGGQRGAHRAFQCPLCKESYRKRPELQINRTLKEITEQFKQMAKAAPPEGGGGGAAGGGGGEGGGLEYSSYSLPSAGPQRAGDMPESVFAEMMTRFQQQQPGNALPSVPDDPPPPYSHHRRYTLSGPGGTSSPAPNLPLCPIHLRGLDVFCRTDNTCICSSCVETAEHRGHSVTNAHREWNIKKSQLGISEVELKDIICGKERKVEDIQNSLREIQTAAEKETEGVVCAFSKLISSVERCQADILEVIEMNRRAAEHQAQTLLKELEEEISELRQRSATRSQLVLSEDYLNFLKESGVNFFEKPSYSSHVDSKTKENCNNLSYGRMVYPTMSTNPQTKDWSGVSLESDLTSGAILGTVSLTVDRLQEELRVLPEACHRPTVDKPVARPNPKIRRVQEYAADLTLDPHTAHPRLVISLDGKQVHCGDRHQSVVDNPERFDRVVCVLSREGFSSGRHYWEVMVGEKTDWDLGVASRSVNRKGKITVSPAHGYWFLSLRDHSDYAFRTEPSTILTVGARPSRIGIYVDCDKGVLSFYNVDARALIYTFTDTFPNTIHPFFSPCTNKSGRNEAPLVICPLAPTE